MADDTRPLTDPERRYLEWWLKHGTLPSGPSVADRIGFSCMAAGCVTMIAYGLLAGAAALLSKVVDTSPLKGHDWLGLVLFALPLVLWIGFLIYFFSRKRKTPPDVQDPRKLIGDDLTGGVARIHRLRATAVLLAYDDNRRKRSYFVRLDDQKILYLANWKPSGCRVEGLSFSPDEKGFPSATFEIAASPHYLLILDIVGTGEYLRPVDEFDLSGETSLEPAHRLESGSFVDVAWEDLRKTYG